MAMKWTQEQQKVIDLRNRNILVSAAAGSGKTAVLVERIISMILDEERPTDIDRLLIVTFTKAAANEMRERIGAALEKKLEEYPENEHLQRQTTLLHHAQISTIHGFCSYVIQNYFHVIDLDPAYRMADEGELEMLKADVAEEVLEACYAEADPEFVSFVETYASGKTDEGIADLIWKLCEYASSSPWPEEWLKEAKKNYQIHSWEELEKTPWMQCILEDIGNTLQELASAAEENLQLVQEEHGPYTYAPTVEEDYAGITYMAQAESYEEMSSRIHVVNFNRLSTKKGEGIDPLLREQVKANRDQLKKSIKNLKELYFFASPDRMIHMMQACEKPVGKMIDLAMAFTETFQKRKREKNLLDFSDLEHLALSVLVKREADGTIAPSPAARELSEQFDEILIDEYQDSNLVQEYLLTQVSALVRNEYNVFMVGDVKQSIYRFRQARPELFMGKLDHYTIEDSKTQRVDLHKNFRSRGEVLTSVNFFFQQIMRRELGGVEYDKDAALYTGAVFADGNRQEFPRTEVIAVEMDGDDLLEEKDTQDKKEMEARAIGTRIRQIVGQELVWDKYKNEYRPARYGDCVILLRTMSGWAEPFCQTLMGMGIPAYSTSQSGYFSAMEVQTLLNFLQICDNPRQDIPYTAVLASPFAGCTPEELAKIKCIDKNRSMYQCVLLYEQEGDDEVLREKLRTFLRLYEDICEKESYTPIHELIWYLVQKSGYGDYVSALPGGEQRIANVRMLVEKAVDYEKTSYGGLYHFVRYIEYLKKYEVDFGEANIVGENDDTVRIMSIHKSKGLEFPVVFVAGLDKRFNQQDMNGLVLLDADYGVASSYIDHKNRVRSTTLMRSGIRRKLLRENLGEELRVLYVAMTRAKEKLILTGTISKLDEKKSKYEYLKEREEGKLPVSLLMDATCYWSWILPALVRVSGKAPIDLIRWTTADLAADEAELLSKKVLLREELMHWNCQKVYDENARQIIEERFSYKYPYEDYRDIPVKVSVSELKKQYMEEDEALQLITEAEPSLIIPEFMKEGEIPETGITGAARGTAYHGFMERIDLKRCGDEGQVLEQITIAKDRHFITEAEAGCLNPKDFVTFSASKIGRRMTYAQEQGFLKREQPFVFGVSADELDKKWPGEETVLVQGIIDAYFYEEDEIVLVDYKTDRVSRINGEEELVKRYQVQLEQYAQALEKLTGKPVKEKIIYSFTLNKEISVVH